MDPLDYLSVRFHYGGYFEHDGNDWVYFGGKTGMSAIEFPKLSVSELKKNLTDFVACSDLALQHTKLHWKYPDDKRANALLVLDDQNSVEMMAKHVTDDGVIDIYVVIPVDGIHEGSDWVFEFAKQFEAVHREEGQAKEVQAEHYYAEQVHADEWHAEEVQADQRKEEDVQCRAKMPVFRPASSVSDRGKGVATEEMQFSGESDSDSDSDYVVPPAESNSSAEDEELIESRKYAKEFKEKRRKKMLGDEEAQACNVSDDFIVPETCKLDDDADDTPYFESDDDLSYDDASDGEVNAVRRRKTTHKVHDDSIDNPQFEVGMAFTDSRQFKQALVKYGLENFHHLLFPKDEKKRVSAKCSWTGCQWSIYGLINSKSDWLLVQRYNNVHTCVPRRDNKPQAWLRTNQPKQPGKRTKTHLNKQGHALSQQPVHNQPLPSQHKVHKQLQGHKQLQVLHLQGHQQGLQQLQGYQQLQELQQLQGHQGHLGHQGLQTLNQAHLHHKFHLMVMGGWSGF